MSDSEDGLNEHERALAVTRRRYLAAAALGGTVGLAGCGGDGGGDTTTDGNGDDTTTEGMTDENTLELAHWWTPDAANAAIQSVLEGFAEEHPDYNVDPQAIAGGTGDALQTNIRQRVLNEDPPSTFQWWPGAVLMPFVEADLLRDIGADVWDQNDMKEAYLDGPKEAARPGSEFVTVPINIHRINNLFYSVQVVEDAGVDPTSLSSVDDLVGALSEIDDAGYVALPHQTQQPWPTLQLWANVMLSMHGTETYNDVTRNANIADYESEVKEALQAVADMSEYFPDDAGSLDWPGAQSYLIRGSTGEGDQSDQGAFQQQGDWAAGNLIGNDEMTFEEDWDMVPFPGTEGMYMLNMDSFPFPKNNPSPEVTMDFLRYAGTAEAQERFNPLKGSIPPRTDVPDDEFNPFLKRQIEDFSNSDSQPQSTAHGLTVPPGGHSDLLSATANFTGSWDVDTAYSAYELAIEGT